MPATVPAGGHPLIYKENQMTRSAVTSLSTLIKSPRTLGALKKAGYKTVEDLADASLDEIAAIPYVGPATIEIIQGVAALPEDEPEQGEIEEGEHDLYIHSPHSGQMIVMLSGEKVGDRVSGFKIIPGVYIKCRAGKGVLTREMWLMRKYKRDRVAIAEHINQNKPWRVEAAEWIRNRKRHGRDYFLLDS